MVRIFPRQALAVLVSKAATDEDEKDNDDEAQAIGEELADVISYALAMANQLQLDVSTILRDKMVKNARKYPVPQQ